MNKLLKRTWAEINLDHLEYNINSLRGCLPKSTDLMAIVKADAYGHGDKAIVTELCRLGILLIPASAHPDLILFIIEETDIILSVLCTDRFFRLCEIRAYIVIIICCT